MKKTITLLAMGAVTFSLNAQNIVTTDVTNRVAIIEEFTGTSCPACPGGHTTMEGILSASPTTVFGIGYSPTNSSLTGPYNGGMDLTNSFSNAFYTNPYYGNGDGRSMPSAHINRTKYSGSRKSSTGQWATRCADINMLTSPVNVGLSSAYNSGTDMVDVTVEMYFTSTVSESAYVTVILTEDDIVTNQSGASSNPYTHKHVMRANLQSGQWGDALTGTTNQGDLVTMNFSFDNSSTNYVIDNCHVVAFVSTGMDDDSEILTGYGVAANGGSGSVASVDNLTLQSTDVKLFPNPTDNEMNIVLGENTNGSNLSITTITGEMVYTQDVNTYAGDVLTLSKSELGLAAGTYFVTVAGDNGAITKKLILK